MYARMYEHVHMDTYGQRRIFSGGGWNFPFGFCVQRQYLSYGKWLLFSPLKSMFLSLSPSKSISISLAVFFCLYISLSLSFFSFLFLFAFFPFPLHFCFVSDARAFPGWPGKYALVNGNVLCSARSDTLIRRLVHHQQSL